jgi:hypothetical protein
MKAKEIVSYIRTRFNALRADESGMETAQVILILVAVVGLIAVVIKPIMTVLTKQGKDTCVSINNGAVCP